MHTTYFICATLVCVTLTSSSIVPLNESDDGTLSRFTPRTDHRARLRHALLTDWETNRDTGPLRTTQRAPLDVHIAFGLYSISDLVMFIRFKVS